MQNLKKRSAEKDSGTDFSSVYKKSQFSPYY